jgi:uncharacterized protein YprB with RNaseH-like and TPR domain
MHNRHTPLLFLDIETVAQHAHWKELPIKKQLLWEKKSLYFRSSEELSAESLYERAGIYAEFGKIVCIAVGYFHHQELRIKAFSHEDELLVLEAFNQLILTHYNHKETQLCAHNGKEFDFPYLARRMIVHGIPLPIPFQLSTKKPWEINHIDTLELWKFGDYKHFTSLDLLADILDIESSKSDIDGSQVHQVFYQEKDLERIAHYCKRDVAVLAQVYLKLTQNKSFDQLEIKLL